MVLTMINFSVFLNNILMMQLARLLSTKESTKKNFLLNYYKYKNMNFLKKVRAIVLLIKNKYKIYKLGKLLKNKKH